MLDFPRQKRDHLPRNGASDIEAVCTFELAAVIETWVEQQRRDHPVRNRGQASALDVRVFGKTLKRNPDTIPTSVDQLTRGALDLLPDITGIDGRVLYQIRKCRTKFTLLSIADQILTALDEQHALRDGRIRVVPNPRASKARLSAYLRECASDDYAPFE